MSTIILLFRIIVLILLFYLIEITNDEDIECAVMTNSGHANEHSRVVEFQWYLVKFCAMVIGPHILKRCKKIMLNFEFECMAVAALTIIIWFSICAYSNFVSDSLIKIKFKLHEAFLLVQLNVISSVGSQLMKSITILPPMMGSIIVTLLTYEYILQDSMFSINKYLQDNVFEISIT